MNNLQFEDFGHKSINSTNDDYRPPGQVGDQSQLFTPDQTRYRDNGQYSKRNFFSFQFYQQYFDVDSEQVFTRIINSMIPKIGCNFITDYIQPFPDLYGPFWISVTLIFSTAICGNLARYIETAGAAQTTEFGSDFRLVTGASTAVFCYVVLVPFILYSLLWYRAIPLQYSYLDILCAYGYSLAIFVPISVFWVLQVQWFRWMLIFASVGTSGFVLANSIWIAIKTDRNRMIALGTVLMVFFLHSLLAIGFKEYYFDASEMVQKESARIRDIEHMDMKLHVDGGGVNVSSSLSKKVVFQSEGNMMPPSAQNQLKGSVNDSLTKVVSLNPDANYTTFSKKMDVKI